MKYAQITVEGTAFEAENENGPEEKNKRVRVENYPAVYFPPESNGGAGYREAGLALWNVHWCSLPRSLSKSV
jgi:hypothetical protein